MLRRTIISRRRMPVAPRPFRRMVNPYRRTIPRPPPIRRTYNRSFNRGGRRYTTMGRGKYVTYG